MCWKVYLGDFGLSQIMSETNVIGTKTMLAGSPGFQSPEQLKGECIGISADVYALGAVILVVFGETQVWPGLSAYQIMFQVTVGNKKPNTSFLSPSMKDIVESCLNNVSQRPTSKEVLKCLLYL